MVSTLSRRAMVVAGPRKARIPRASIACSVGLASALIFSLSGCATPVDRPEGDVIAASLRMAAQVAEQGNDYHSAAGHYTTLLRRIPGDNAIALGLARNLRYSGNPRMAIEIIRHRRLQEPGAIDLSIELGKAYLAADEIPLAVLILNEAIAARSDSWEAHAALGVAYDYQGRHDMAQQAYGHALKYSPGNMAVLNNMALSTAMSGKLDNAIAILQPLTNTPDTTPQIRQNLALLLALRGDAASAERLVRKDLPLESVRHNLHLLRRLAAGRQTK